MMQTPLRAPRSSGKFDQHRKSATSSNRKFLVVGAVILVAAVTIGVVAMQGSSVYYVPLAEFNAKQATIAAAGQEIRVAGRVLPGSIERNSATGAVTFTAFDKEKKAETMKVVFNKIPPDTFKDEAEVVVTGTFANGVFQASEMLAKCPSKYSSQPEEAKS